MSYLLFADDMLIFGKASQDQITYICWLLTWFKTISGFKINLDSVPKSSNL